MKIIYLYLGWVALGCSGFLQLQAGFLQFLQKNFFQQKKLGLGLGFLQVVKSRGYSLAVVHRLLIAVASPVAKLGLQGVRVSVVVARGLSCSLACGIIPCIGRQILNHWTTREISHSYLETFCHKSNKWGKDSFTKSWTLPPLVAHNQSTVKGIIQHLPNFSNSYTNTMVFAISLRYLYCLPRILLVILVYFLFTLICFEEILNHSP